MLIAVATLITVGGCSGGGGDGGTAAGYCKGVSELNLFGEIDPSDPKGALKTLDDAHQQIRRIDAPKEIAAEFETVEAMVAHLRDALKDADTSDTAAFARTYEQAFQGLDADAVQAALAKVTEFEDENCTTGAATTTDSPPVTESQPPGQ